MRSSFFPAATSQKDGTKVDVRIEIRPPRSLTDEHGNIPKICRQETVTIHEHDHAKFRQELQYGSEEHYKLFNLMRQFQEGEHGRFKDEAYQALGSKGKRRMRGRAAQSLFTAFLLAASTLRKIRTYLQQADEPADKHALIFVTKRDPAKRKNTWHPDLPDSPDPPELRPPLAA